MKSTFIILAIIVLLMHCTTKSSRIDYASSNGRYITINSRRIYVEEYGQGPPLLLLSGGGINRSIADFGKCVPKLSNHFRVILPDTPGQGRSEQTDSLSYDLLTDAMSKLIDSLKVDSIYVMGWSDGGIVSLLLANRRDDRVKKVIAVGANNGMRGFELPEGILLDSVKPPTLEYWAERNASDIAWYSSLEPKKDWRKMVTNLNRMVYQKEYFPVSVYGQIKIPVMLVLGDRDDISVEHGLEMHKSITNSQYCVLPNTSHEVFSEQPDLITTLAIDYLSR